MDSKEILDRGRELGLSPYILKSPQKLLIRSIQRAQGKEPCFLSDHRFSCNHNCEWTADCKKLTAAWLR